MAEQKPNRLVLPGSSWETVKRIIRAYDAVQDKDNPTVEDVAKLSGVLRPVISLNNNFLRDAGFLQEGTNKLTVVGARYAKGLHFANESLITDALQELIRNHGALSYIANMLKARGEMKVEALRGEMIVLAGVKDMNKASFVRAFLDILQEAKVLQIEGDSAVYRGANGTPAVSAPKEEKHPKLPAERLSEDLKGRIVPIPLGIGRLVKVELPEDWGSKDLPKLLKMLEISLGDGETS